jgi:uncharacterized protein DUF955
VKFRRGFEAEADRLVVETRSALGLELEVALDTRLLAGHLGIEVFDLTGLHAICPDEVEHLTTVDVSAFSGTLLERDGRRAIFVNDAHTEARQAATIAHECAHVILGHEADAHFSDLGIRRFDDRVEAEADWLGDCLLVPTPAVLSMMRRHGTLEACAVHFGVSEQLMRKRYNLSGARQIIERSDRRRRARG